MSRTLVLPGGASEALAYRRAACARREALIGASSVRDDAARDLYDRWVYLPPVHAPEFADRFHDTVGRHDVDAIFCSHPVIYDRLGVLFGACARAPRLVNPHPVAEQQRTVAAHLAEVRGLRPYLSTLAEPARAPSEIEIAGLLQATAAIPGQSGVTKLATLMALFPSLPAGDVVEVGVYWGRSAFALAWLASRYQIGAVLAVDAWAADLAVQHDAPELIRQDTMRQDWEAAHAGFLMHVMPVAPGRLSYLRAPSLVAAERYPGLGTVRTPPFGPVSYRGRIALLHLDGNHDHAATCADLAAWTPFVEPGGWIVLDDYVWAHGDGPRRAGDAFLAEMGGRISRGFVAGGALFMRLSSAPRGRGA